MNLWSYVVWVWSLVFDRCAKCHKDPAPLDYEVVDSLDVGVGPGIVLESATYCGKCGELFDQWAHGASEREFGHYEAQQVWPELVWSLEWFRKLKMEFGI